MTFNIELIASFNSPLVRKDRRDDEQGTKKRERRKLPPTTFLQDKVQGKGKPRSVGSCSRFLPVAVSDSSEDVRALVKGAREEGLAGPASHSCEGWMGGRAPEGGGGAEFEERKTRWEPNGEGNEELDRKR